MQSGPGQQVALEDLNVEQLSQIKQQLDEEIQHLTQSFAALKQAQARFQEAKSSLDEITPAKAPDAENVLVDVGARYYVEKSVKDAKTFYNTKILDLRKSLDKLQPTIELKNENRQTVVEYLQMQLSAREKQRTAPQSKGN
ncbi:subunit of tubulin prefoldin [Cystobasidiomycetes sp. EMM_F5]